MILEIDECLVILITTLIMLMSAGGGVFKNYRDVLESDEIVY